MFSKVRFLCAAPGFVAGLTIFGEMRKWPFTGYWGGGIQGSFDHVEKAVLLFFTSEARLSGQKMLL
ncbi:MAG: hypothetical protein AAF998_14250 [Bacteroidota bacterium]